MERNEDEFVIARHDIVKHFEAKPTRTTPPTNNWLFLRRSANTRDDAHLDIRARCLWRAGENSYFDVWIINADNDSQRGRMIEVEQAGEEASVQEMSDGSRAINPIVLSTEGVMGKECEIFHKPRAHQIATKTDERRYDEVTRFSRV